MQRKLNTLPPEILLEEYRRILAEEPQVAALPLIVSGRSMTPFLVGGRDTVYLSRLERPVRRGDILLYQRDSGQYVLHRVWKVEKNGTFTMVGDAQVELEHGIREDQVIAIVTFVLRKEKTVFPGFFWWEFFEKIWIRMVPLRPFFRKVYSRLR